MYKGYDVEFVFFDKITFHSLYLSDDGDTDDIPDKPFMLNGKIIFTRNINMMTKILHNQNIIHKNIDPFRYHVNISDQVNFIRRVEHTVMIMDCLNIYFDYLLEGIRVKIPQAKLRLLYKFANYITIHNDFSTYGKSHHEKIIEKVINFIQWGTGVILSNSILINDISTYGYEINNKR